MAIKDENEKLLHVLLNEAYPNEWEQDVTFLDGRKHRGDAVNKSKKVLIEIEGGLWLKEPGRHNQPIGYMNDMEKYNLATLQGWRILRYTPEQLRKNHWRIISDVRQLCGYRDDAKTTQIDLAGCKQATLKQMQVRIS